MGAWDKTKAVCRLKWTEGDYWVTETPIFSNKYFFDFKYVIWNNADNKMVAWERGIDRIIDCEILDNWANKETKYGFVFQNKTGRNSHCVILNEVFEKFETVFSVNLPNPDSNDQMEIIGNNSIG